MARVERQDKRATKYDPDYFGDIMRPLITVGDYDYMMELVTSLCWATGKVVIANRDPDGHVEIQLLEKETDDH